MGGPCERQPAGVAALGKMPRGGRFAASIGEMAKKDRSFPFSRSAKSLQENVNRAAPAAAASYTLVGAILLLGGLGYVVDRWQDTEPWFLLAGLLLGMVVGFWELAKTVWRE